MGAAFSKQIDILSDPQIKYHHFDFHQECSKMKWHRVSLLLDHFHSDFVAQGYVPLVSITTIASIIARQGYSDVISHFFMFYWCILQVLQSRIGDRRSRNLASVSETNVSGPH